MKRTRKGKPAPEEKNDDGNRDTAGNAGVKFDSRPCSVFFYHFTLIYYSTIFQI